MSLKNQRELVSGDNPNPELMNRAWAGTEKGLTVIRLTP